MFLLLPDHPVIPGKEEGLVGLFFWGNPWPGFFMRLEIGYEGEAASQIHE